VQPDPTSLFTWLHLSDIHHQHGDAATRWDQVLVLDRLRADIALGSARGLPKPDAILVTGDIAYSGNVRVVAPDTESREYEKAKTWLDSICQGVGLPPTKVFMVPGNHDVQRASQRERQTLRLIEAIRTGKERIDEAIDNPADRQHLLGRLRNYAAFAKSFAPVLSAEDSGIVWHENIEAHGMGIRLVGLNTSLLANDGEDEKRLYLGNWQLARAALALPASASSREVVVVLTHHPLDWLGDGRNANEWMSSVAHVHLCGHIHTANIVRIRTSGGKDYVTVTAGASHDDSGAPSGHGYSLASIVRYDDGRLALRVWPRIWSSTNKDFRVDVDNLPEGSSYYECDLRLRLDPSAPRPIAEVADHDAFEDAPDSTGEVTTEADAPPSTQLTAGASDAPPVPAAWVGRTQEIQLFDDPQVAVIGITGIGGQGKSALAARYIDKSGALYDFWDWRDCREEGDTLQTHIVRAIERLSQGRIAGTAISAEDIESHVGLLFQSIGQRRVLMVFDNIDHYVDTESNKAILGMRLLIESALRRPHAARIIVTCRPALVYDDVRYFQLALGGLTPADALALFELREWS
jgi:3',5'-cyclic AMP phosphodiesterase CpdA